MVAMLQDIMETVLVFAQMDIMEEIVIKLKNVLLEEDIKDAFIMEGQQALMVIAVVIAQGQDIMDLIAKKGILNVFMELVIKIANFQELLLEN